MIPQIKMLKVQSMIQWCGELGPFRVCLLGHVYVFMEGLNGRDFVPLSFLPFCLLSLRPELPSLLVSIVFIKGAILEAEISPHPMFLP